MSRSYKKPFIYWCKSPRESHKWDKTQANRSFRRAVNKALYYCLDYEELLIPHRYEAAHNDRWGWLGDGSPFLYDRVSRYLLTHLGIGDAWKTLEEAEKEIESYKRK